MDDAALLPCTQWFMHLKRCFFCSVFSDPAECERQRSDGVHKYWTQAELREELWKTMKGLAELELRENNHFKVGLLQY
jgi:hypothetical protein